MRTLKTYDCGTHGQLTAAEICARACISRAALTTRLRNGESGESLVRRFGVRLKVPAMKRHDCGTHGLLTVPEMAARSGLSHKALYNRIAYGVTGEALLAPRPSRHGKPEKKKAPRKSRAERKPDHYRAHSRPDRQVRTHALIALRAAALYAGRVPETAQLRVDFHMSKATACRWRRTLIAAWGDPDVNKTEHRVWTASTAHATAHEVTALREADKRIAAGEDARTVLLGMIDDRQLRIDLLGGEGGHA